MTNNNKDSDTKTAATKTADTRLEGLEGMLAATAEVLGQVKPEHRGLPTPCSDFDVAALCEHLAVWIQVFDATVNDVPLGFDPEAERIEQGWQEIVGEAGRSIVAGLRSDGHERMMTMAGASLPGEMVLNMMLMEYVGHSWDLTQACGLAWTYDDHGVEVALAAAEAIVQPEHRASPMFGEMVPVGSDAAVMDRFVAFIGRDPEWRAKQVD